jgi:carboxyl-terminal processing protease
MGLKLKQGSGKRWLRGLGGLLIIAVVFLLGVAVGDGRLNLPVGRDPKPVAANLPAELNYESVNRVYKSLKDNYDGQLTQAQLEDGLKHGLAAATKDPYTVYMTAKEAKDFNDQLNNSFSGIGAQLGQDKDGNLEVIAPIDDLPAAKAGLKAKDIIANINGTSTSGMSVDEAVSHIRGKKGTVVKLQVVRNRAQALSFSITRDDIKLPSVKTKILDGNIGYLQITSFANDTSELTQKAAQQFKDQNVKAIILDMRDNPGGYLDAAIRVSSLWLPSGQSILQEKRGSTVVESYSALGGSLLQGVPTVVLINAGSASASEITAGALHDNKAAYVIGEKSYGKGVVQQVVCVTGQRSSSVCPSDVLKVTVASWYRPNGQNINKKGISPDKTVKISDEDAKAGTDTQLEAAKAYLSK